MASQVMLTCATCGVTFFTNRANAVGVTSDRMFCSEKCAANRTSAKAVPPAAKVQP